MHCANGTVRADTNGVLPSDCSPCPAGFTCHIGDPVPLSCSPGYYCELGRDAVACPLYTYNPFSKGKHPNDCLPCPAGFLCNSVAIADYRQYPCPLGYFCTNSAQQFPCPGGTYRDTTGASNIEDCLDCPPGEFCPIAATAPCTCSAGYYCPAKSANATICPPGYYCGSKFDAPKVCSKGYYCPQGSYIPQKCNETGTFCPEGTDYPLLCPNGMTGARFKLASTLSSLEIACDYCRPGEYSHDLQCFPCPKGYVCLGGTYITRNTSTELVLANGYMCPEGI